MPQPALTVFLIIAAIAIVVVLIAVIVIALRAQRRRKLAQTLEKRRDDEVQYAFIVNPSKPQAEARRLHIQRFCEAKGLNRIRFYDTQLDKDGRVCALEALEDGADVVIAVGGDGTVRTVASAVSGTGHALGIIPIGTGNLFARNMGVPVDDIDAALTVATSHGSRLVDMGRLTLLDHPEDDHGHAFLIIAGIGFDAAMIDDTNPELKANISWLAYFVGGVKNLFAPKFRGTLTVTSADGSTHTIKNLDFRTVMAGNCGQIPMFSLMPAASLAGPIYSATWCIRRLSASPNRTRCPRTRPSNRFRASVPKSHWKSRPKRRWTVTCCRKPATSVSRWITAR